MVRHWLVFFGPAPPAWWTPLLRPGFHHVLAAGYDPEREVWLLVDPARDRLKIEIIPPGPEVDLILGTWWHSCAPNVLRMPQCAERRRPPAIFSCTGAIKALLGVKVRALGPAGLFDQLLARGAERVTAPAEEPCLATVQDTETAAGGSQCGPAAAAGAATG